MHRPPGRAQSGVAPFVPIQCFDATEWGLFFSGKPSAAAELTRIAASPTRRSGMRYSVRMHLRALVQLANRITVIVSLLLPCVALALEGGYGSLASVAQGQRLDIHISTKIPNLSLRVFRNAENREQVFAVDGLIGEEYECSREEKAYRIGCGWPIAYSLDIPRDWPSGMYEIEFPTWVGILSGRDTRIRFVIREESPGLANILVVVPTNTDVAYNRAGGKSVYHPLFGPAHEVSYDRPTPAHYETAPDFAHWAEREQYRVEYATDVDFHADPELLDRYACFATVGHSEYWSREMRDHLDKFTNRGGNALILSANTAWWQVRFTREMRSIIVHKFSRDPVLDDDDPDNNALSAYAWRTEEDPETSTLGLSYRYGGLHDFVRDGRHIFPPSDGFGGYMVFRTGNWVFDGTGLEDRDMIGREATIAGYEMDGTLLEARNALGNTAWDDDGHYPMKGALPYVVDTETTKTPANFQVLGVAPASSGHGVMGYFEKPSGGIVFNAGTIDWAHGLVDDVAVQRITGNLVNRLCETRPGLKTTFSQYGPHRVSATVYGSEHLDVRDIDQRHLRLTGAESERYVRAGRFRPLDYRDIDGDGRLDATTAFRRFGRDRAESSKVFCLKGTVQGQTFRSCNARP
jgi:hypothetical protein